MFFAICPLLFFQTVAQMSTKYAYKDWVVEKKGKDRDGNEHKQTFLVGVPAKTKGRKTPGRCH